VLTVTERNGTLTSLSITPCELRVMMNYLSILRLPETRLTLNGRNIPLVNHVKYLGVIFDKRITWRLHIEIIEVKAFRTFIRIYSLFRSKRLSANIKLTSIRHRSHQ
jgi:hypothetical protein